MSDQDQTDRFDPRVRELTYRLMGMAPDAPPFPEEAPAMKVSTPRQRPPALVWAATAVAAVLLVGLPLFLFRGDNGTTDPATTIAAPDTTTTTLIDEPTTTVPGTTIAPVTVDDFFKAYMFSDAVTGNQGNPALVPLERMASWPEGTSLDLDVRVGDAIRALDDDDLLEQGYGTAVLAVDSVDVEVSGGVATLDFPAEFESGGGSMAMMSRLAQVVFTATQFPEIDSVIFEIDGEAVEFFSGEGIILDGEPQTREDYHAILTPIFLDTPVLGYPVSSPVTLSGVANVFEATVSYEIVASGALLAEGFTTASCGTGCWGDFAVDVDFSVPAMTEGEIIVYEESARDGSRINELRYPVTLLPGGSTPGPTTTIPPTSTTLPGEAFDIGPAAGDVVAVVGVAHDDVLNVRDLPGASFAIVTTVDPLADDLVATGRHRLLTSSIWDEVTANGITGWVNSSYIGYLGGVDDLTSQVVSQMGGIPEAETMLDLGTMIAESFDPGEGGFRYEMVTPPSVGDLGEVTFDVVGLLDDSQLGWRLHIFGQPTEGGEGFSLMSVEATALCGRGVTEDGLCI
jgi:immunoglobulin-like protein involved in spore germination/sporulation and spore germination protein